MKEPFDEAPISLIRMRLLNAIAKGAPNFGLLVDAEEEIGLLEKQLFDTKAQLAMSNAGIEQMESYARIADRLLTQLLEANKKIAELSEKKVTVDYKKYRCGCSAGPAKDVPDYCPDHGDEVQKA